MIILLFLSSSFSYDFSDYDFSSLKRSMYASQNLCIWHIYEYCRSEPYKLDTTLFDQYFLILFNVYDTFTSSDGFPITTEDCIAAWGYPEETECVALNSTENTTFSLDGRNITSLCLCSPIIVKWHNEHYRYEWGRIWAYYIFYQFYLQWRWKCL